MPDEGNVGDVIGGFVADDGGDVSCLSFFLEKGEEEVNCIFFVYDYCGFSFCINLVLGTQKLCMILISRLSYRRVPG